MSAESGTLTLGSGGHAHRRPDHLDLDPVAEFAGLVSVTGITNNGGVINVAHGATVTDALTNSGAVNNAGTYNADVTNNGGAIQNAATGVWNGALTANTGLVNNAGTWNATGGQLQQQLSGQFRNLDPDAVTSRRRAHGGHFAGK